MQRDLDLIREMMLALEANSELNGRGDQNGAAEEFFPEVSRSPDELTYHLILIIEEGWVQGSYIEIAGDFILWRLTADGHDFIDATRNRDVWNQARQAAKAGGTETLRFVWDICKRIAQKAIEKRLGFVDPTT
jgi:hypothetical protein